MKNSEIKNRHHYVWAHYLKSWGNGTKNVHYSSKKLKISHDSVKSIAFDFHFYKLTKLSKFDVEVITGFSKRSTDDLHKLHMQALNQFLALQNAENAYLSLGVRIPTVENEFEGAKANILEDIHTSIELSARPIIDELIKGNFEILDEVTNAVSFFNFFGHQATRTKSFKDKVILVLNRNSELEKKVANSMDNSWWFLSYLYGSNLGTSFFSLRQQARVSLLKNNTEIPFITADQPIINVHKSVLETVIQSPEAGDFYYPLSPSIAFIISDSERFENGVVEIDEATVIEFNTKIASQAIMHIFGDSEEALRPYMKFIGSQFRKIITYKETT